MADIEDSKINPIKIIKSFFIIIPHINLYIKLKLIFVYKALDVFWGSL